MVRDAPLRALGSNNNATAGMLPIHAPSQETVKARGMSKPEKPIHASAIAASAQPAARNQIDAKNEVFIREVYQFSWPRWLPRKLAVGPAESSAANPKRKPKGLADAPAFGVSRAAR